MKKAPGVLVEEAKYFLELCNATLLTTGAAGARHAQAISDQVGIRCFTFHPTQSLLPVDLAFILESNDKHDPINPEKGLVLLFTSGTTGPPKGVLHSRRGAIAGFRAGMNKLGLSSQDTWLLQSPVHWAAGFWQSFVTVAAGACVEFCANAFNPDWLMERMSVGDVSCLFLTPALLDTMEEKLHAARNTWPSSRYGSVMAGFRGLRVLCSGSMPVGPVRRTAWKNLRGGKPLMVRYGMSEEFSVASSSWESDDGIPLVGLP